MRLYTYNKSNIGVLAENGKELYPITQFGIEFSDMNELIAGISKEEIKLLSHKVKCRNNEYISVRLDDIKVEAPIIRPKQDVICLGLNFFEHAEESMRFKKGVFSYQKENPVYFSKRVNQATGCGDFIPSYNEYVDSLDYEVELAVIISKDAYKVPLDKVEDYIFGYTILNDVSARNLQSKHGQWFMGKSLDGFTPMGPCITTADEIEFPPKLAISSKINGELRQNSNTENFIFDISYVINQLSQCMTLKSGTIISMGTPSGVGMGFEPPKFLKSGDKVECIIENIGVLENIVS